MTAGTDQAALHRAPPYAERFFLALVSRARIVLAVTLTAIIASAAFVPSIVRNTTADAFIDPADPALIFRDRVEEIFGLKDSMVVAIADSGTSGIYRPETLALLNDLTGQLQRLDNIDPARVTSLATENNITGTEDGLIVESFFGDPSEGFMHPDGTTGRAAEIRSAVDRFPLLKGSLVAEDGSMAIIVAELIDAAAAETTYRDLTALVARQPLPDGVTVHVAGEGAVAGYLSAYIDRDAVRVNPLAGLVITVVLIAAFMSVRGALIPNLIVLGTAGGTFGLMALSGVNFYVITNGLVGNLIGIAVADSIYVLSQYYDEQRRNPGLSKRQLTARAMSAMWRPITLTTVTTCAGFLALYMSSVMPPVKYFGLFGAVGVALAWFYSMTLLPACLALWPSKRLAYPFRIRPAGNAGTSLAASLMTGLGRRVLAGPRTVLLVALIAGGIAAYGALKVEVNDAQIESFQSREAIYVADKAINAAMDGTYFLDVMVETENPEDLYTRESLIRIEQLQTFLAGQPGVGGSVSIVDYAKQLHKSVNEDRSEAYVIPDDELLIPQLFFLYNASSDPTDFDDLVDPQFQRALIRANVARSEYQTNRVTVPAVETYLAETFNAPGITGTATGRVTVDFYWLDAIARTTWISLGLSFAAATIVAMIVFRSFAGGLLAATPVALAVLCVYAVMGYSGIWLGVGTSMFAAIAIGLAIDFAIHTLDRLRELVREHGFDDGSLSQFYPTTGRALFFNFFAVTLGFGVLMTSDVPPLVLFGTLVAVAITTAFLSAVTIIPAVVKLFKPAFLTR